MQNLQSVSKIHVFILVPLSNGILSDTHGISLIRIDSRLSGHLPSLFLQTVQQMEALLRLQAFVCLSLTSLLHQYLHL